MAILAYLKRTLFVVALCLLYAPVCEAVYVGPTDNITKVANAIQIRSKSLTTVVSVPRGLATTQPVTISIGFYSPAGSNRLTQTYTASMGTSFLYNDREAEGQPREMRLDITLTEANPGGRPYSYAVSTKLTLDPLYRVSIGPLTFGLLSACDSIGQNEIRFGWRSPEKHENWINFNMPSDGKKVIEEFSWSVAEAGTSKRFPLPSLAFEDVDSGAAQIVRDIKNPHATWTFKQDGALVIGKSQTVKSTLAEKDHQCTAYYQYRIQSTLLTYLQL